ncbi:yippee zinc-binding/DNA-binding /Mis18, centromere assembly-domain-containing protein, partial [Dipodascopsis uninucleata]
STITVTVLVIFIAFLLWQVLLAYLIVRPGFYRPSDLDTILLSSNQAVLEIHRDTSGVVNRRRPAAFATGRELNTTAVQRIMNGGSRKDVQENRSYFASDAVDFLTVPRRRVSLSANENDPSVCTLRNQSSLRHSSAKICDDITVLKKDFTELNVVETLLPSTISAPITIFKCRRCQTHLAMYDRIVSKGFTGRFGRAVLVTEVSNIIIGNPNDRMLTTGMHTVADIACTACGINIGWKYLAAYERSQVYKMGKYILELSRVIKETVSV